MTEDWNTTDELKKDIITAVYKDINDQIEEMVEDLGCPRSFAEGLLKSIEETFKMERKVIILNLPILLVMPQHHRFKEVHKKS